ncbi:phosphoglycerate kinase [Candidatus Berkelbacteria bacterium]|nr:phosphoglycerate kinase [Candidatus Berkelbacteria bacterium]
MTRLQDIEVKGKYVVVRLDLNVPLSGGNIVSDFRIRAALPTITYLQEHGAKQIVLLSHLGRPVGRPKSNPDMIRAGNPTLSLAPVAKRLRDLLGTATETLTERVIEDFPLPVFILTRGLYLAENLRFDWREEENDPIFAAEIAALGDCFVFDAFSVAHRAHASTAGVMQHTTAAVAGLRLQEEVATLEQLSTTVAHPFVAVLGGAKMKTKLPVLQRLIGQVDQILLGGVMANTFAKALDVDVRQSVIEPDEVTRAGTLAKEYPDKVVLPQDYTWNGDKIVDIGPTTRQAFTETIGSAKTVFWNGTLGLTSTPSQEFKYGSLDIARAMMDNRSALTIVSGGDTVGLLEAEGLDLSKLSFVSTGGGATLKFLAGESLPALVALGYTG